MVKAVVKRLPKAARVLKAVLLAQQAAQILLLQQQVLRHQTLPLLRPPQAVEQASKTLW
jgi:hypothetical protein